MATMSVERVTITAPKFGLLTVRLIGKAPYVQLRFGEKAKSVMRGKHLAGSQAKKGKSREARNFDEDYLQSMYGTADGRRGIPAGAFRNACISACRLAGFKMTLAKLSIFIEADAVDATDGTPLVFLEGEPKKVEHAVRNATGVADLRVRAMWENWACTLRVRYDEDQFSARDALNLLARVGMQVGIGEGRPDSKESAGMGWGLFALDEGAPAS